MRRKTVVRTAVLIIAMAIIVFGRRYVTGASFVVQAAGIESELGSQI